MTCCPSELPSDGATMRARKSLPPPGVDVTMRTGLVGYLSCAYATVVVAASTSKRTILRFCMLYLVSDKASQILRLRYCVSDNASQIMRLRYCVSDKASQIMRLRYCALHLRTHFRPAAVNGSADHTL